MIRIIFKDIENYFCCSSKIFDHMCKKFESLESELRLWTNPRKRLNYSYIYLLGLLFSYTKYLSGNF